MSATATTPDLQKLLDASGAPQDVKASAWDAYHQTGNQQDFQARFDKLQIPQETKASLWDIKFSPSVASPVPTLTKPQADAAITQATRVGGTPIATPQKPFGFDLGSPPAQPRSVASIEGRHQCAVASRISKRRGLWRLRN